ncbi:uncharacterized protein KY384_003858 [Bacidia gigantensis]|uniref:uncharacterized protein n=1 Tax=Bacidia gigantensis TaxID=2732470 RepID=UPI001D056DD2|nr:uncharacterized protein KY384_003858 [Bacidia gigantensis]KAG8532217.1 hypothetical protein KY384_003858 [Bacidia gigantensis]
MVHNDPSEQSPKAELRQVEFNTIAASFGGLSAKVSALHKHLHTISAFPEKVSDIIGDTSLPSNPSIALIAKGLQQAHQVYGPSRQVPTLPLCILFVVQDPENNVFDQYAISSRLQEEYQTTVFRLPFSSALTHTTLSSERSLIYNPSHAPSTSFEVTTLYYRAGYSPSEYSTSEAWDARLHLERSAAIKCPSILTHLAGSKKIQQILATPSSPYLERFLSGTPYEAFIERIRATFAAIYPLDDSEAGQKAIAIAKDEEKAKGYVLKPQREGGGNNIYGTKIPPFVQSLGSDERKYRSHILMELIEPPPLRNTIFRNGQIQSGEVIGELGIYGVCLWKHDQGEGKGEILENYEAGFLLRTKGRESEEGGVAAGFGAVDSPCLAD